MTAEPVRRPEDDIEEPERSPEDQAPAEAGTPGGSDSMLDEASQPVTAPGESLTPEAAATAEAEAAAEAHPDSEAAAETPPDPNVDPDASEAAVAAADSQEVATTAQAVATIDAATDAPADKPVVEKGARRRSIGLAMRQLAIVVIGLALLVAGVALGNYVFQTQRASTATAGGAGADLVDPPAAAQEFIAALAVNDADAVRSSLDMEPHLDLMREMERRGIQKVDRVEVLGTSEDGPRSATEILMRFQRQDGISSAINLVILVDGGKIEGFR